MSNFITRFIRTLTTAPDNEDSVEVRDINDPRNTPVTNAEAKTAKWMVAKADGTAGLIEGNQIIALVSFEDAKTASYTVVANDKDGIIPVNTTSGNLTITLPNLDTTDNGFQISILKTVAANTLTIDGDSTDTINGEATFVLNDQYHLVELTWTGTEWIVTSESGEPVGEDQVQSDWGETDATKPAYIKGKPTIPTVPDRSGAFTAADEQKLDAIPTPGNIITRQSLLPTDTTFWASWSNDFDEWASADIDAVATFHTGVPSAANMISTGQNDPSIDVDWTTVRYIRMSARQLNSANYVDAVQAAIDVPTTGTKFYMRRLSDSSNNNYAIFTVTAVTTVGTGNAKYYQLSVTVTQTGTFGADASTFMKFSEEVPSDVKVAQGDLEVNNTFLSRLVALANWPAAMVSGFTMALVNNISGIGNFLTAIRAKLAGAAETTVTRTTEVVTSIFTKISLMQISEAIQPEPEHTILSGYRFRGIDSSLSNVITVPSLGDIGEVNPNQLWINAKDDDLIDVERYMRMDHVFRIVKDASNYIEYTITSLNFNAGSGNERYASFVKITQNATIKFRVAVGTISKDDTVSLELSPAFITVDRVTTEIRNDANDINIPTEKAVRDAITDADDLDPEDTVPFAASFRDVYSRTFVTDITGNDTKGQASTSSDNTVPSDAPPNTTAFIDMDKRTSGDTDQGAELAKVGVGDWIRAKSGTKYIIAKIQHIQISLDTNIYEFWFNPSTAIDETLQWDELPNGAGEIRFYKKGGGEGTAVADYQNAAPSNPKTGQLWWDADETSTPFATKNGVHRRVVAELEGTTGSTAPGLSLITASYTPQNNNARIYVRLRIAASCVGNSDNDYSQVACRVKRGSGNYKRIDEGADGFSAISGERMWQYSDNTSRVHYEEFELEPQDNKDEIKVNLSIFMKDGASVSSSTGRLNRWGTNRNLGPSFIEIYELVPNGEITRTTITSLDAA